MPSASDAKQQGMSTKTVSVPSLVRIKPEALDRIGIYLARERYGRAALLHSDGLKRELIERTARSLTEHAVSLCVTESIRDASVEQAMERLAGLPAECQVVIGLGGGKALDSAKYVAFLAGLPYYAVPTSLSNDGFCSPQASLTLGGRRKSLPARLPAGVVVDTAVCLGAPIELWWSGIGDLVAKITAIRDWKLAFHARGEPVNDLAALLSDATVRQFIGRPERDLEGMRLLGTSLMLNGIAMEISGSSRPASGSEHLISHALDHILERPRLHGLQVGVAAYLVAHLQGEGTDEIGRVLDASRFWDGIRANPFRRSDWIEAVRVAPSMKPNRYTVLSERDVVPEIAQLIESDPRLVGCFVE